jgi:hypothetical protein
MRSMIAVTAVGIIGGMLAGCLSPNHGVQVLQTTGDIPQGFINVTQALYGAKGDGKNNDTDAIQRAVRDLKPGGVLYFPSGTYLTDPITITTPSVTLMGCSSWRQGTAPESVLCPWSDNISNRILVVSEPLGRGLRLSHLTFDGLGKINMVVEAKGVQGQEPEDARLRPLLLVEDCKIIGAADTGLYLNGTHGADVRGSLIKANGSCGIYGQYACDVTIQDSQIIETGCGVYLRSWDRITLAGSRFAKNRQFGFLAYLGSGSSLQCKGCYLDHNQESGLAFRGTGTVESASYRHVLITGNVFEANGGDHVELTYVRGATITGNAFIADSPTPGESRPAPPTAFLLGHSPECTIMGNDLYLGFTGAVMSGPNTNEIPIGIGLNVASPR